MDSQPKLPVAISYIGSKYLIFDINIVTWLRKAHCICGVMTGTLPQAPSQNVFLGLPVQIMPEEAQLLVDRKVGYIVDDAQAHDQALHSSDTSKQTAYLTRLRTKGEQISMAREEEKEEVRRQKLKQGKGKSKSKSKSKAKSESTSEEVIPPPDFNEQSVTSKDPSSTTEDDDADDSLFDSTATLKPRASSLKYGLIPHDVVPTTSDLWLRPPPPTPSSSATVGLLQNVPPSYALYKHLNSKSYYITPGLRFGCQYTVYPGDPLRFHSHFLAVGVQWDEEIDLMNIVGGGRLGTGVKKGFLIGGEEPSKPGDGEKGRREGNVRTFSVEWAAM